MKVIIIGGGFAGLSVAKKLANKKNIDVLMIDRRNHHLFQPLLYQVATAALSPADIATPIRSTLSSAHNIKVVLEEVIDIDRSQNLVITKDHKYTYDQLVVATGAVHSYFGHDDWEDFAPGLKSIEQATEIRRRILIAFEEAEKETDREKQREWLTFIIIGGGPTGVEMAGAIAEISRTTLEEDFRSIDPSSTRILLIEAGPRVLASFHPQLSKTASRDLENLGVQIWTHKRVTSVSADKVQFGEELVRARTVIWAAGVAASPLGKKLETELDSVGRVMVKADLSLPQDRHVFVIGDMCAFKWNNTYLPGLAPVAMQQGRHVAQNILADAKSQARQDFQYLDKGSMATVGRKRAVVEIHRFHFAGFFAWLTWLFIHIYYLIGFRNRLFVFLQWTWSYMTFKRGARLIANHDWKIKKESN